VEQVHWVEAVRRYRDESADAIDVALAAAAGVTSASRRTRRILAEGRRAFALVR
jgi:hypothetical protein